MTTNEKDAEKPEEKTLLEEMAKDSKKRKEAEKKQRKLDNEDLAYRYKRGIR